MQAKILIVEDNPDWCDCLTHMLIGRGYKVHTAGDGQEALYEVREGGPDLIISDIMMPFLGGIELVETLRQTSKYKDIPVMVLTAHDNSNLQRALRAGADEALRKPIDFDHFFATIEKLLNQTTNIT
jgi:CheY-like chemotaxis protein